ncbi:MAG TPA: DUF1549 and DUF1553 domain-containing protein [Gemmataceae bacterium]|nr:DUF1549 and DUF1553 domain-containing protein [Gemmataceae bacterium]
MTYLRLWLLGCVVLLTAGAAARGADPPPAPDAADVQALAAQIDKYIAAAWASAGVQPAPLADDAEFLRRVYLDLAGRIPSVAEARAFLKDPSPDKRLRLAERLVESPRYVTHWTNVWRGILLPEASANIQARLLMPSFEAWLREKLAANVGYNELVRELLTVPIDRSGIEVVYGPRREAGSALAYYLAKEASPENLAAGVARVFLGIRLECAQCHDHPFATWKREQFWGLAAFFAGIQRDRQGDFAFPRREVADKRELTIPGTERVVQATYPDGTQPVWRFKVSSRQTLADWLTSRKNPYFAKATVNRLWFHFFGRGLIDPVDEMVGGESEATHPELLDELAREFAAHQFDLKFLIRAIVASRTYQLTSAATHPSQQDTRLFARMPLRGLTPEQLFDSLSQATGYQEAAPRNPGVVVLGGPMSPREEFLSRFTNQSDRPTEVQTSILQALSLMNGRLIADATDLERSETLAAVLDAPFLDTRERIETLYLAALSRKPRPNELERLLKFVENSDGEDREKARRQALADIFWVLLNSGEFFLNH